MPSSVIQWFPGHMAKTKRLITECLPLVDIVIEVLDARIPVSSKNPVLDSLLGQKPRLAVFSKSALADPEASRLWQAYYRGKGTETIFYDCRSGDNLNAIAPKVREILGEKLERYESKGMTGRKLKAMIVGIPNVGKSSLINALAGSNRAKVENRPGVTLTKQWITTKVGIDLLDMPGVLWPKFEDRIVGENLAITGAIKDDVLDIEQLAVLSSEDSGKSLRKSSRSDTSSVIWRSMTIYLTTSSLRSSAESAASSSRAERSTGSGALICSSTSSARRASAG